MLQPDPRSGEGCDTLLHEGLAKRSYTEKIVISTLLYTFLSGQVFKIQSKNNLSKLLVEGFNVH